jgi:hypothetical protein
VIRRLSLLASIRGGGGRGERWTRPLSSGRMRPAKALGRVLSGLGRLAGHLPTARLNFQLPPGQLAVTV